MDARRSRLPEKPVNIRNTAQKARSRGGAARPGMQSPNRASKPGGSQISQPAPAAEELNSKKLLRFLRVFKLLTRPLTHYSPSLKNNKFISKFFRKVEVLFNKNNRHITAIPQ